MRCGGSDLQASSSRAEMLQDQGQKERVPNFPNIHPFSPVTEIPCTSAVDCPKIMLRLHPHCGVGGGDDFGSHCHAGSTLHKACFTLPPREDRLFNLPLLFCSFCCVEDAWMVSSPRSRPLVNTQGFDLGFGLQNCENFCSL